MKSLFKFSVLALPAVIAFYWWGSPTKAPAKQAPAVNAKIEKAIFAAGCFWCVESNFEKVDGVIEAVSGYTGGEVENPTYEQVCSHTTQHLEAVEVSYDANQVSYNDLLEVFWRTHDPTDEGGSFHDRGLSYSSAIFVADQYQRDLAEASKKRLAESGRFKDKIATKIRDAKPFYVAEDYHQNYYQTHPVKYKVYRMASGRDRFIADTWGDEAHYKVVGPKDSDMKTKTKMESLEWSDKAAPQYAKPNDIELRKQLTSLQYEVTQHEGTERPFKNDFWSNKEAGIYVDIVSGEPLFSSLDKFKSGTGWPSFTKPIVEANVTEKVDRSLFSERIEVRSKHSDSHLGHVFNDGPQPTGLRYCINSAALKFVPVEELSKQGYGFFKSAFDDKNEQMNTVKAN